LSKLGRVLRRVALAFMRLLVTANGEIMDADFQGDLPISCSWLCYRIYSLGWLGQQRVSCKIPGTVFLFRFNLRWPLSLPTFPG